MNPLLEVLTEPPRLLVRALDDLHRLAVAAEKVGNGMEEAIAVGRSLDDRGRQVLSAAEKLEDIGRGVLKQGEELQAYAAEVALRGAELVAALPFLERALEMTQPLEGAVERLGRMVDLLPGGTRRPGTAPKKA